MQSCIQTSDFPRVKKNGSPSVCDSINFPSPVFADILVNKDTVNMLMQ